MAALIAGLLVAAGTDAVEAGARQRAGAEWYREATTEERRAVLDAVDRFHSAVAAGNADAAEAQLLPAGTLFFQRRNDDGSYSLHQLGNAQWLAQFRGWTGRMEDISWAGEARVWGPVATVVQSFIFRRNGSVTHCGVNLMQLAKEGAAWRIANIVWTEERLPCPQPRARRD